MSKQVVIRLTDGTFRAIERKERPPAPFPYPMTEQSAVAAVEALADTFALNLPELGSAIYPADHVLIDGHWFPVERGA